jgi:heme-degrading monooxygenase HmoA
VWEFIVRPEELEEFERCYSSAGAWAELFRQSAGFRGTELLRDAARGNRYVTIDSWESAAAHDEMRRAFGAQYAELDRVCARFTKSEQMLGVFEIV